MVAARSARSASLRVMPATLCSAGAWRTNDEPIRPAAPVTSTRVTAMVRWSARRRRYRGPSAAVTGSAGGWVLLGPLPFDLRGEAFLHLDLGLPAEQPGGPLNRAAGAGDIARLGRA